MDLVILFLVIGVVVVLYQDVKFVVYLLGILEIFFRIVHYLGDNISFINLNSFVNRYIPSSMFSVAGKYTSGIVYDIVSWFLVIGFIAFLYYLVEYFFRKK